MEPTMPVAAAALSHDERTMLRIEARWPQHSPVKEVQISHQLGLSAVRYYRRLAALVDTERAVAFDPMLVGRLRGQRDAARGGRAGGV